MKNGILTTLLLAGSAALLGGCQGVIFDPGTTGGEAESGAPAPRAGFDLGESRLRPLNQREYDNTVRDLFVLETLGDLDLPRDQRNARGFDTDGAVTILTQAAAEQFLFAAEAVATQVVARGTLADFGACADQSGDALHACLAPRYEPWLAQAFRSAAASESVDRLAGLVATVDAYPEALEVITVFTLVSPHFLFHYKSPAGSDTLDAFEVANRLSYLLWATLPDAELLAAARDGSLAEPEVRAREAQRMLDDPRADRFVDAFLTLWLNVDRLPSRGETEEEAALYADMVSETMTFGREVFESGAIVDLLTADHTFVNARLARHYGLDASGLDDATFVRRPLPAERQGILTHASLLAARSPEPISDPIRRGVWTAVELLCSAPDASPPPDVDGLILESGGQTPREVLAAHQEDPVCASCHQFTDPYGLALETFDALGVYREVYDNGRVVDPSGELATGERFADVYELADIVAGKGTLERCVTEHLATYGLGRILTTRELDALHDDVEAHLDTAGVVNAQLRDLIVGLVQSPLFVRRGGST